MSACDFPVAVSDCVSPEGLHQVTSAEALARHVTEVPATLGRLLADGVPCDQVITSYSAFVDTVIRRAIELVFASHPQLSMHAFTWLALGSFGRREAVLSSDVDSAVELDASVPWDRHGHYRAAFGEVHAVLDETGLSADGNGTTAQHRQFTRAGRDWRAAARQWLTAPSERNGAMMMSLLVDGRATHGDLGARPTVTQVFHDIPRHRSVVRFLLRESLSRRARRRTVRTILGRRAENIDLKAQALRPIVNIGRWAALSSGSTALATTERLREAAGSIMLPEHQATTLIEVFGELQQLRLRHQLTQHRAGGHPSDIMIMSRMSTTDRTVIARAIREVSSIQQRMDNISNYVPIEDWTSPQPV